MTWELVLSPFEFAKNQAHKLYWKMKLENESKLLILDMYLQNYQNLSSTQTSSDSFLQKILLKLKKTWNWFPGDIFHVIFWQNVFFRNFTWTSQISSPDWVYFPSYLAKCVSCFMLKHLMTSLHLNIWKVKS